jgi:hypothetical protein
LPSDRFAPVVFPNSPGSTEIAMPDVSLIVADPGHFHAALVQKEMYPNLSPEVHVYAPLGPDLADYLTRIARFNTRKLATQAWKGNRS